ncbi:MAG TPA: hypothetical protein PKH24_13965 [Sedimentisphaerales bacterium]|jgi:hypothetical protein|nr:hypothetical protein [Sedimentisphaerales bacterium]HNU28377.1 hypothetical protein [Sedimentisphaerales bacterium]
MRDRRSKSRDQKSDIRYRGVSLALAVIAVVILTTVGMGLLTIGYGVRHHAISAKADAAAMLAAEAGYEKAVFWMGQQQDMLSALQQGAAGTSGSLTFPDSSCTYQIGLYTFVKSRPVFRVVSHGYSGIFERCVDVLTVQMISGWDMGLCRIPTGATSTDEVNFKTGEVIDLPIHINKASDSPDIKDIFIIGSPSFLQAVAMGEDRYTAGGGDKYASVMSLFDGGIYFNQPASRVTDEGSVQSKVSRFRDSTLPQYQFTPTATATSLTNRLPAVQLEFFVEGGIGKVRITNNCSVRGFRQSSDSSTYDFKIKPGTGGAQYERYYIYTYHVASTSAVSTTVPLTSTYVTQSFGGTTSDPGGQIFVNGNVVIGGNSTLHNNDQVVKGTVTVVATGNIWIADSIYVDGSHRADGLPADDNPNVLGLLAQGVIKVVDPGLSDIDGIVKIKGYAYMPVGRPNYPSAGSTSSDYYQRYLPDPTIVEAAITVGGGGWGAENVWLSSYGGGVAGRKEATGSQDYLRVHGTITECIRGVVGVSGFMGADGYLKSYHMDNRLLTGIVPGDIWLRGKYVPAPAGWHDYRPQ